MKWSKLWLIFSLATIILVGCGSPTNFDQSSMRPDVDMLAGVQRAVDEFQKIRVFYQLKHEIKIRIFSLNI